MDEEKVIYNQEWWNKFITSNESELSDFFHNDNHPMKLKKKL